MTLEEAVAVLNARRHRGFYYWELADFGPKSATGISEFEAVAIAEKYERESPFTETADRMAEKALTQLRRNVREDEECAE